VNPKQPQPPEFDFKYNVYKYNMHSYSSLLAAMEVYEHDLALWEMRMDAIEDERREARMELGTAKGAHE
jgi:hypothetical protein